MARSKVRETEGARAEGRCPECGARLHTAAWAGELCSDFGGLSGEQYAEIFWDEA